jgi:hypothetical protein
MKWTHGVPRQLPPNAIAAKVLCERHNASLSVLDSVALRVFEALDDSDRTGQSAHLFCGHDVERWLLKVLCGAASAGLLELEGSVSTDVPRSWLEILFGDTEFQNGQGLYVCKDRGHRFTGPYGIGLQAIVGRGALSGIGAHVCGYELILSMSGFPTREFDGRRFVYRPLELLARGPTFEKSVLFSWHSAADLGTISMTADA